jgi:hypothetical protein
MFTPLSLAESQADAARENDSGVVPLSEYRPDASERETSDKLGKYLDGVMDRHFSDRDDTPKFKNLDEGISAAIDAAEEVGREREAVDGCDEYWTELHARHGADLNRADLVERFIEADRMLRANPRRGADWLANAYLQGKPYPKSADRKDDNKGPQSKLDAAITAALDKSAAGDNIKIKPEQLAYIRKHFGCDFREFMRITTAADRDLHNNPLDAAVRIAASYGMPVTAMQEQEAQELSNVRTWLGHLETTGQLPRLGELAPAIEQVLNHPNFRRSGDINDNLARAYAFAEYGMKHWPARSSNAAAVAKAKAASSPRSRGTAPNGSARAGGIDAAIVSALAKGS